MALLALATNYYGRTAKRLRCFLIGIICLSMLAIGITIILPSPRRSPVQDRDLPRLDYTIKRTCGLKQVKATDPEDRNAWHFQIYRTPIAGRDPKRLHDARQGRPRITPTASDGHLRAALEIRGGPRILDR